MTSTQQIARISHPSDSKKRLLSMIAYFDESGKPEDKPIVSLAALVALDTKWFRFDVNWNRLLAENKAPIHPKLNVRWFHMNDFSRRNPPYDKWKEQKRISFCASLARFIKDTIVFGTCHSLVVQDWNEIIVPTLESQYKKRRGWYVFLMQAILLDIAKVVRVPTHERIACVFDQNKEVADAAKKHYSGLKGARGWDNIFGAEAYERSPLLPGLQAADLLAFEGRRAIEDRALKSEDEPLRKVLENMTARNQILVVGHGRPDLLQFHSDWMKARAYREALKQAESLQDSNS